MDGPGYQSLCQHPRGPTICEAAEFFAVASALLTAGQSSLACLRPRGRRPFDRAPTDMAAAAEFLPSMVGRNSCPRLADHLRQLRQLRQLPRSPPRPAGSSNCPNSNRRRQGHDPPIAAGVPPPHPPPLVSGPAARDQFGLSACLRSYRGAECDGRAGLATVPNHTDHCPFGHARECESVNGMPGRSQ